MSHCVDCLPGQDENVRQPLSDLQGWRLMTALLYLSVEPKETGHATCSKPSALATRSVELMVADNGLAVSDWLSRRWHAVSLSGWRQVVPLSTHAWHAAAVP